MNNNKELIEPIEFFKVDKICDDVYFIGLNVVLKFNVVLSRTDGGKRTIFHKEFEYPSKYDDIKSLVTIRRTFDFYLSIENILKDADGYKVFIRIGPQEYYSFKTGIEIAMGWFTNPEFENLFAKNKGEIIITPPIPSYTIKGLPQGKSIELQPIVITRGISKDDSSPGIRMYFDEMHSSFVDINVDKLFGLHYIISNFNMYQAAIEMVNYIERPEFGTNRISINQFKSSSNNNQSMDDNPKKATGPIGRFVTPRDDNGNPIRENINLLEE